MRSVFTFVALFIGAFSGNLNATVNASADPTVIEGDGFQFLQTYRASSFSCDGSRLIQGTDVGPIGRVEIRVEGVQTESPEIEVRGQSIHFKIGNSFVGSLRPSSSCRYYSTTQTLFYVCGLIDASKPITFLDVRNAARRASLAHDLVCSNPLTCIRLSNCR